MLWAGVAAGAGAGLGLITHVEGTIGEGGVQCGSVWLVSAYHSGCQEWLDDMASAVFAAMALSVTLLLAGLVRWRGWTGVGWALPPLAGLAILTLGPRVWRESVFLTFGY